MTKEIAIAGFKESCLNNFERHRRIIAVGSQYNRNVWEINNRHIGLIRIGNDTPPSITIFVLIESEYKANSSNGGAYKFDISIEEYDELKDLYFADIKESDYLLELGILR